MAFQFRKFLFGLNLSPKTSSTADSKGDLEAISGTGKLGYHNGTSVSPVVTETHTATLTNKSIDGNNNTITNISSGALASGIDATKIADGSVDNTEFQYINTLSSNAQTQLNNKQPLDATLTSLAAYNTNGLVTQTAADTFTGRTITGTTNQVNVSNGDGVSGNPTLSLPQSINTGATPSFAQVTVASDPSTSLQVATKQYVDALGNGIKWKASVLVATTANITLSGEQTIDGVLTSTSRVLVKNQSSGAENGIYVSASGAWSRSTDADSAIEVTGASVLVEQGTASADKGFIQTADNVTLGTTPLVWTQNFGTGLYTADGQGIELSGSTFSLELDGTSLSKSSSGVKVNITGAPVGTTDTQTLTNKTLTSPTIAKIGNLTTNGYVKTSGSDGTLSVQTVAIPVADGGTGQTSYTDGQLLIGNTTGNTLTKSTLTAGTGISITNSTGSITIAASGGSTWTSAVSGLTTRDTATPTAAGHYRTMIKNSSSLNLSDTDGSAAQSSADGAHWYTVNGTSAGTSGQPNYWEIYIGTNKRILWQFYSTTGRAGSVSSISYYDPTNLIERGPILSYDPSSGVAKISLQLLTSSGSVSRDVLIPPTPSSGGATTQTNIYFDIYYQ